MRKSMKKAYEITDAKIQFVSLVNKAANKKKFLITKAKNGEAVFSTYGRIIKKDSENHYVTGVVYEPMTEDSHGNYMTENEIIKAAYWFAKNGNKIDLQHSFENAEGITVVENWVAKTDFKLDENDIKKGTWLMTAEIANGDIWDDIEKGEITGFSMGGLGNYSEEDVDLKDINKSDETEEKKGLLERLSKALSIQQDKPIEKAGKSISGKNKEALQCIYNNLGTFLASFDDKEKEEIIEKNKETEKMSKKEFEEIIAKSVSTTLKQLLDETKDGNLEEIKKENEITINTEDLKKMIAEAVAAALKAKEEESTEHEQIQKMVTFAVQKAIAPILKSKGLPNNLNGSDIEKAEEHYLHGIL